MRKLVTIFVLAVAASLLLGLTPVASDILSVPSTGAVSLPRAAISGRVVAGARVTNIGATLLYFSVAGAAPTTSTGDTIYPGAGEKLESPAEVSNFQVISATGTGSLYITLLQ
jgi:hypothetical protein